VLILEGRRNDDIRRSLDRDDLPCPENRTLDALRAAYAPKKIKATSPKAIAMIKSLGLSAFFPKTADAEAALFVLRQPRVRELGEAGLVLGTPTLAISLTLKAEGVGSVSPTALDLYGKVFLDSSNMTRSELRRAVEQRVRLSVMRGITDPKDEAAAQRAVGGDPRVLASTLPRTPLGFSSILMAAGYPPIRRELGSVFGELESFAIVRAGEALLRGEAGDERRADSFVGVIEKLRRLRETVSTPDVVLAKKLSAFRIEHDRTRPTTGAALTAAGGQITVDLGPPPIRADDPENEADESDDGTDEGLP
jgi:hypothetical protein